MKLEKGKTYLTAGGTRVDIVADDMPGKTPMLGVIRYTKGEHTAQSWTEQGKYYPDWDCETMDLVKEYVDKPVFDRSLLPPWCNKAIAMEECGDWFAHSEIPKFTNGTHWGEWSSVVCEIPPSHAPKWKGAAKDSLLVWEDEE